MVKQKKGVTIFLIAALLIFVAGCIIYLSGEPAGQRDYSTITFLILALPVVGFLGVLMKNRNNANHTLFLKTVGWIVFVAWLILFLQRSLS